MHTLYTHSVFSEGDKLKEGKNTGTNTEWESRSHHYRLGLILRAERNHWMVFRKECTMHYSDIFQRNNFGFSRNDRFLEGLRMKMERLFKSFAVVHWKDGFGLEWGGKWRVAGSKDKKVRIKLRCILNLQPVGSDNGIDVGNERDKSKDIFLDTSWMNEPQLPTLSFHSVSLCSLINNPSYYWCNV